MIQILLFICLLILPFMILYHVLQRPDPALPLVYLRLQLHCQTRLFRQGKIFFLHVHCDLHKLFFRFFLIGHYRLDFSIVELLFKFLLEGLAAEFDDFFLLSLEAGAQLVHVVLLFLYFVIECHFSVPERHCEIVKLVDLQFEVKTKADFLFVLLLS